MKKTFLTPLLFLFVLQVFAQQKATVSGKVLDANSEEPLPYATVTITKQNAEKMFAGVIADEQGRFVFEEVPVGNHMVSFSFVGYETKKIPLLIGKLNHQ